MLTPHDIDRYVLATPIATDIKVVFCSSCETPHLLLFEERDDEPIAQLPLNQQLLEMLADALEDAKARTATRQ